jgi:hypothetical protein
VAPVPSGLSLTPLRIKKKKKIQRAVEVVTGLAAKCTGSAVELRPELGVVYFEALTQLEDKEGITKRGTIASNRIIPFF